MHVCIAVPPIHDFYTTFHRLSGLGCTIVARLIKQAGHVSSLYFFPLTSKRKGREVPLPHHLSYLSDYILPDEFGPVSFFTAYRRFGADFDQCADRIARSTPDLLFLSNFAFCYADDTLSLAEVVKSRLPRLPIAVGGGGPSSYPEYFFKNGSIDFVFSGEAEASLPSFLRQFDSGSADYSLVPNLLYHENGKIEASSAVQQGPDVTPMFAWSITKETKHNRTVATSVTRGCPKGCSFCSIHLTFGRSFRTIPLETIKQEIRSIPKDKKLLVNFEDDNCTADPDYFFNVLRLFHAEFENITFTAENGVDYTELSPEMVKELGAMGFQKLNLTLGSIDPSTLASSGRRHRKKDYETILEAAKQCGLSVLTYCIAGLTDDRPEKAVSTLAYLASLPTTIGISLFYPVPGLPGFEKRSFFDTFPSSLTASSSAFPWNGTFSTRDLITLFRIARTVNFLKNSDCRERYPKPAETIIRERRLFTLRSRDSQEYSHEYPPEKQTAEKEEESTPVPVSNLSDHLITLFFSAEARACISPD